jgi:hypothetical protein
MVGESAARFIRDTQPLKRHEPQADWQRPTGGVAVADAPPHARIVTTAEPDLYMHKANRIVV